jgi:membrane protease YdiL (CAAX protease family)
MTDENPPVVEPVPTQTIGEAVLAVTVPPPKQKGFVRRIGLLRLIVFFFVLSLFYALPQVVVRSFMLPHVAKPLHGIVLLAGAAIGAVLSIAVYALLVGWLEKRHIIEMRLKHSPQLIGGMVLALLLFVIVYGAYFATHAATWKGFGTTDNLIFFAALALISGVCEELIFRGGVYRILEDMFGSGVALILSGLLFGAMHLGNPHATYLAGAAIAIEAGILLGAAYAATRSLWLPIGIHIGWNFTEGGIFGASVSGGKPMKGLFDIPLSGPDWLTGGGFGPEASVVPMVICTLAGLYFVYRTIKKGRWCRIGFRMMLD